MAVLILAGLPYRQVPPIALLCNLVVSSSAFWHFFKGGHFDFRKVLPFIIFSIPMAFLGGTIPLSKELFYLLLGFSLLIAGARMLMPDKIFEQPRVVSFKKIWSVGLPVGAGLGFLSGIVGIGGGIFLSPLLLLMRWVNAKEAAAAASFFILVNSFSGFLGQTQKIGAIVPPSFIFLGLAVLCGGQIGSSFGSYRLPRLGLQRVTALLILYVSFNLIRKVF